MDARIAFLRYCLDDSLPLPENIVCIDWKKMMAWANDQAVVGVIYHGIQRAGNNISMPFDVLMAWVGYANRIEVQNKIMNQRCVEVVDVFKNAGYEYMVLKGQGNALIYPNPLLRSSGDIDVWVNGKTIKEIIRFAREKNPGAKACYHHVEYGAYNGVEVEVHYRPSFMYNPIHNYRLQKWFSKMAEGGCLMAELPEGTGGIRVPNMVFNVVFQISHVYNHLLHEGIGLRQIIDYYYLLKSNTNRTNVTNYYDTLRYLGLETIAGAMMWVLNEVLGLPESYLIAPKDEKRGKVLLAEIMKGGNFGHYDAENKKANNAIKKNLQRIKRDVRMMRYFPSECLWEPVFRWYHFFWRVAHSG